MLQLVIARTVVTTIDILLGIILFYGVTQRKTNERGAELSIFAIIMLNILAIWV